MEISLDLLDFSNFYQMFYNIFFIFFKECFLTQSVTWNVHCFKDRTLSILKNFSLGSALAAQRDETLCLEFVRVSKSSLFQKVSEGVVGKLILTDFPDQRNIGHHH